MKLMVLDGNSIINRAFFGVRLLSTRDGVFTNAIFGFLNIYHKLMEEEKPDSVCVTFDLKAPTFRHKRYEGYKAQRKPMPEELRMQIPLLKEVLDAMNVRRFELEGYEADDLIGTMSVLCREAGWECVIVTGDKDSFQLITDTTRVKHIKSRMGQTETIDYTEAVFREEYGFAPKGIIDLKALMGDTSDNIPGVPGVGEKTALELIRRFSTLQDVYENLESPEIRESVRKKLLAGREMAELSYELATICLRAPIVFRPEECRVQAADNDRLYKLFQKLEFYKWIERLGLRPGGESGASGQAPAFETVTVTDPVEAVHIVKALPEEENVAVMLTDFGFAAAVPGKVWHFSESCGEAKTLLFSGKVKKTAHFCKDLIRKLLGQGVTSENFCFDTALAAYLLEPTSSAFDLETVTQRYLGYTLSGEEEGQLTLLPEKEPEQQTGAELQAVLRLEQTLAPMLRKNHLEPLLQTIELPLCPVLAEMEEAGFLVDREALSRFGRVLESRENELQEAIWRLTGEEFNISSPKQLGTVLFEKLMLPAPKKTKTGYSTNAEVLEKLKRKHPVIPLIMEYRELSKLRSTYADGLQRFIGPDGRIHTTFQMTATATGRLSSTEPNLQNIPVRSELGGEIRKMFTAPDGYTLVDADYSQIELRLLAHISGDAVMQQAFRDGEDIHRVTASQVFDVPFEEVTSAQRSSAKAVNFGIVYGISKYSLSQDIGVSVAEAGRYIDNYLAKYSGVRQYMTDVVEQAKKDGFVTTLYGRIRQLPEISSSNFNLRAFGERVALNMPVQGTAADIMKLGMIRCAKRLKAEGLRSRILLQVHDELIAECPLEEAEQVKRLLCEEMERAAQLSVPLTAEAGMGKTWFEAK